MTLCTRARRYGWPNLRRIKYRQSSSAHLRSQCTRAPLQPCKALRGVWQMNDELTDELKDAESHKLARRELVRLRVFRSEEHTSELQSRFDLVCRLLLEKKKKKKRKNLKMSKQ